MKNLNHLLMLSLFANFAFGETSPNYKVTQIANPPSKFGTKQIDGLDFLPDGRMVVLGPGRKRLANALVGGYRLNA